RIMLQTTRLQESKVKGASNGGRSEKTILTDAHAAFDLLWRNVEDRRTVVDAKLVIKAMNSELAKTGVKARVSALKLAMAIGEFDIGADVRAFIGALESHLSE